MTSRLTLALALGLGRSQKFLQCGLQKPRGPAVQKDSLNFLQQQQHSYLVLEKRLRQQSSKQCQRHSSLNPESEHDPPTSYQRPSHLPHRQRKVLPRLLLLQAGPGLPALLLHLPLPGYLTQHQQLLSGASQMPGFLPLAVAIPQILGCWLWPHSTALQLPETRMSRRIDEAASQSS